MTGVDRIDELYASTLAPRLDALEGPRRALRGYVLRAGLWVGVPVVLFVVSDVLSTVVPTWAGAAVGVASFAGIFVGVVVAGVRYLVPGVVAYLNYRTRFKHEVAAEVFRIVCPTAEYAPAFGVAREVFDEPGIFSTTGGYTSDDRVRGRIGATPFEAADVSRSYSTGGKNSRTVVVFRGLFFHLDFNKRLTGRTVVQPADAAPGTLGSRRGLTRVRLENPAFDAAFTVHASDEVEARYILTPAMMERILSLAARTAHPIFFAFTGQRAYLAVNYGRALFEPGIAATTSLEAIREMAAHFALAEGVVEELDLNTRIWTKQVDDSLLHAPGADAPDPLGQLAARGEVTASELWEAAQRAAGMSDDADDVAVAPPPGTGIRVEHGAGRSVVHYGWSVGFVVALALSVGGVAVTAVAARALPAAIQEPQLVPAVGWLPEVAVVPDLVRDYPLPFVILAPIVGGFATLVWVFRVRRVEVAADAIRIWRGVRPWPRRYARPLYGKVVRTDKTVHIGKTEGFALINATASPMLSVEESRWVAAELRRALRATAH
ncbi:MAG: DUF3137 domain-containing protein [Vicinamibacterales bacterium]